MSEPEMRPCVCGHTVEEHVTRRTGDSSCDECDCIAYEADDAEADA